MIERYTFLHFGVPIEDDDPSTQQFLRLFRRAVFDPTGGLLTAGLALGGSAMSAAGTLMGGNAAAAYGRMQQQAEQFQATQDRMNAASDTAAGQRKMFETKLQADLTQSKSVANAAAGGVTTTTGSPLATQAQIGSRGHYEAALDLWNGQNAATADINKAAAADFTGQMDAIGGQMQQQASVYSAFGTLASGGASAYKLYGMGAGASGNAFMPSGSFLSNGINFG